MTPGLPVAAARPAAFEAAPDRPRDEPLPRVLAVDDDPISLRIIARALADACEVRTTASPLAALELLRREPFDVLLSDLMMDELDGLELIRRAREVRADLVILMLTGAAAREHAIAAMEHGVARFLLKPLEPAALRRALEEALAPRRSQAERRRLEAQLAQAQKLESIGQLAAGIAHEINTPIQYVGDNMRFLSDAFADLERLLVQIDDLTTGVGSGAGGAPLSAAVREACASVDLAWLREEIPSAIRQSLEGIERVAHIVRAMKEFSHPGARGMQSIDVNRAIESTITVARNEWKYVAEVETDFDPELPAVDCLAGEFNQVVLNLLVNAAHAIAAARGDGEGESGGKGTIRIRTRRDGDWLELRVADSGCGIPAEIRPRVFDPFFTTKEVGKGTGQGLALVHAVIVKKHSGTVTFESEIGRGTTFVVRVPLRQAEAATAAGAPEAPP